MAGLAVDRAPPAGNRAEPPTGWSGMGEPVDVRGHPQTRVCDEPGCATRLSRYNEHEYCALHQPMIVPRMRGRVLED